MKVLITGGSGLLGSALSSYFKDYFKVFSTYTSHNVLIDGCKIIYLDVTDVNATINTIKKIKPNIIIHTAALIGVTICEKNPELAYKINVEGTKNIANAAKNSNSKLIYISTDYIFDGKKGKYRENDKPKPINIYGWTKLEGEKSIDVKHKEIKNVIIRTSIYGWNIVKEKKSLSTWMIDELSNKRNINAFTDQISSATLANSISEPLKEIIEKDLSGTYNIASIDAISKYDFAIALADIFNFDKRLINPVKNKDIEGSEKRPLNVSLDVSKAKKELKSKLLETRHSLLRLKELKDKNYLRNFKVV